MFPPLTKYFLIHCSYLHIILLLLSPFLLLYFQRFAYIKYRRNYLFRFHICIKKGITIPLLFLEKNLDKKFRDLFLIRLNLLYICKNLKNKVLKVNFYQWLFYATTFFYCVQIEQNALKFKIAPRKHESIFNFVLPITRGPQ